MGDPPHASLPPRDPQLPVPEGRGLTRLSGRKEGMGSLGDPHLLCPSFYPVWDFLFSLCIVIPSLLLSFLSPHLSLLHRCLFLSSLSQAHTSPNFTSPPLISWASVSHLHWPVCHDMEKLSIKGHRADLALLFCSLPISPPFVGVHPQAHTWI